MINSRGRIHVISAKNALNVFHLKINRHDPAFFEVPCVSIYCLRMWRRGVETFWSWVLPWSDCSLFFIYLGSESALQFIFGIFSVFQITSRR